MLQYLTNKRFLINKYYNAANKAALLKIELLGL